MKWPGSNTKKKKVTWSDNVDITVDAETTYYTATQCADIFVIVDKTQIPITLAVPARADAVNATPNTAEATLDRDEAAPMVGQCKAPNTPAWTTLLASAEATQRVGTG